MKRLILLFFVFSTTHTIPFDFKESAQKWILTYCSAINSDDLLRVADLLYYSLKRSESTLETQQATTAALEELAGYSLSVIQTRLNPSKQASTVFDKKKHLHSDKIFVERIENYIKYNRLYDTTVQAVVHGESIQSALLKKGILELRENARSVVAHALNEHIYSLQKSLREAQNFVLDVAHLFKKQVLPKIPTRSFLEYVWAYIPQFLVNSFITFDTAYKNTHEQLCNAVIKETEIGNSIWTVIETARASWYRAHYTALKNILVERSISHDTD